MARIRKLNAAELEMWSRAIHRACSRGWVPALRSAFAHLAVFVDEDCPTAYTDCQYRVGLGPDLLNPEKTTDEQLAMCVIHETMHNTQKHRQRLLERRGMNGTVSNFVTDLEINSIIAEGIFDIDLDRAPSAANGHWEWLYGEMKNLTQEEADEWNERIANPKHTYKAGELVYQGGLLPRDGQFFSCPPNKTAEQYLEMLDYEETEMSLEEFQQQYGNGSGSQGSANDQYQDAAGQDGQEQDVSAQVDGSDGADGAQQGGQGGQGGKPTVSGQTVKVTKIYRKNDDGTRTEIGKDALVDRIDIDPSADVWKEASALGIDPITRGEEQRVKEQIAHEIEEQRRSNGYGSGAGDKLLDYVSKGLRPPVVDWKKMLRRMTSRACQTMTKGRDDFSWQKLSRRYSQGKYLSPGLVSYTPTVRLAIDTSGSMSAQEYKKALSEAEGILRCTRAKIECVCVDAKASEIRHVRSVKEITSEMVGGGGTDMGAALSQVVNQKPKERPDVLVIATDGCYDWDSFARQLAAPELKHTAVIVLIVYKFDEDSYYASQGTMANYQALMRQYDKDARLVQAWV